MNCTTLLAAWGDVKPALPLSLSLPLSLPLSFAVRGLKVFLKSICGCRVWFLGYGPRVFRVFESRVMGLGVVAASRTSNSCTAHVDRGSLSDLFFLHPPRATSLHQWLCRHLSFGAHDRPGFCKLGSAEPSTLKLLKPHYAERS